MFNDVSDSADDIYNSMDPPTATLAKQAQAVVQNAQQFKQAMNTFDDDSDGGYYGGGCFHGNSTI